MKLDSRKVKKEKYLKFCLENDFFFFFFCQLNLYQHLLLSVNVCSLRDFTFTFTVPLHICPTILFTVAVLLWSHGQVFYFNIIADFKRKLLQGLIDHMWLCFMNEIWFVSPFGTEKISPWFCSEDFNCGPPSVSGLRLLWKLCSGSGPVLLLDWTWMHPGWTVRKKLLLLFFFFFVFYAIVFVFS